MFFLYADLFSFFCYVFCAASASAPLTFPSAIHHSRRRCVFLSSVSASRTIVLTDVIEVSHVNNEHVSHGNSDHVSYGNSEHVSYGNNEHVSYGNNEHVSYVNSEHVPEIQKIIVLCINRVPMAPFGPILGQIRSHGSQEAFANPRAPLGAHIRPKTDQNSKNPKSAGIIRMLLGGAAMTRRRRLQLL